MATKYDEWLTDAPYDDEGEWVAERAEELAGEIAADVNAVNEVMEHVCGFTDYTDKLSTDLAQFFVAFDMAKGNESCAEAGLALFNALEPHVMEQIKRDAETKAQAEWVNRLT